MTATPTRLLGFCRSILHNQAEAEDCLQDVFVIAATRLSGLREPALLRSWLFSVARHECLARIDKRKREVLVDEVADRPSFDPDPSSNAAVDAELAALLRDAQAGLSDRDRLLLELADRQQLAGEEFAAAVGVTRSTAYTLLARARATAKKSIGALLVARTGRDRCAELDGLLADWDGELTVLSRKQVARHIEKCSVCDEQRSRVASAAALLGGEGEAFAAQLVSLRTRILGAAAAAMEAAEPLWFSADGWDDDGWPPQDPVFAAEEERRRRGRLAALLVAGVVAAHRRHRDRRRSAHEHGRWQPGDSVHLADGKRDRHHQLRRRRPRSSRRRRRRSPRRQAPRSRGTRNTARARARARAPTTSASPSPSPTPSSRTSSAHPTKTSHGPTPTHKPTSTHPSPSRTKSSVPVTSSPPPTSTPPTSTPPQVWVLTVQPQSQAISVAWANNKQTCPGSSVALPPPCSYNIVDGSPVAIDIGRAWRFDSPPECTSSVTGVCSLTMDADKSVTVHIS